MEMADSRVKHVVVDSGAFIRNAPIKDIGENIYSIREVVREIKDKATRDRLQVLPYQIVFREPSADAIRTVTEFARKTGDYRSLSAVDLRLLALTYQLEKEHVGTDHIKTVPDSKITWTTTSKHLQNPTEIAGFYLGKKKPGAADGSRSVSECTGEVPSGVEAGDALAEAVQKVALDVVPDEDGSRGMCAEQRLHGDVESDHAVQSGGQSSPRSGRGENDADLKPEDTIPTGCGMRTVEVRVVDQGSECDAAGNKDEDSTSASRVSGNTGTAPAVQMLTGGDSDRQTSDAMHAGTAGPLDEGDVLAADQLGEESSSSGEEEEEEEVDGDDESEDEDGWITPSNIHQMKQSLGDVNGDKANVPVGCLTTDFAMQNVLIQMGLNVVSTDGLLIKRTKNYVLRCFACFKITGDLMRQFCGHCGNKTLQKVSMTTNADGTINYYLSRRTQQSTRGTKYSLPAPKGGKHASNPILCEDQKEARQHMARSAKVKYDALGPDYTATASPFAPNDVYSRSALLGVRDFKHAFSAKRNPNERKKNSGHRK